MKAERMKVDLSGAKLKPGALRMRRVSTCVAATSVLVMLLVATLHLSGCAYVVTPAATIESAATITLVDMGRHSEVVFPRDDGSRTLYAFGEWEWFALDRTNPLRALNMAGPSVGTLGRRNFVDDAEMKDWISNGEANWEIAVEAAKMKELRDELDAEYAKGEAIEVIDHLAFGLRFVPVNTNEYLYLLVGNNCNDASARWLRAMGCRVTGAAPWAKFVVNKPRDVVAR